MPLFGPPDTSKLAASGDVKGLIKALRYREAHYRGHAAIALGDLGDARAVEPLVFALREEDSWVSQHAAEALAKIGDAALEPLIAALRDQNENRRMRAASALGQLRDAHAVEPLIVALRDQSDDVRLRAASALGELCDERAVAPLIEALGDQAHGTREAAARALGKLGDARAVEPLVVALGDEHSWARHAAAEALGELGDAAVKPLIAAIGDAALAGTNAAQAIGERAALVLGERPDQGGPDALPAWLACIGAERGMSDLARAAAWKAVDQLGTAEVFAAIYRGEAGEGDVVRSGAAKALSQAEVDEALSLDKLGAPASSHGGHLLIVCGGTLSHAGALAHLYTGLAQDLSGTAISGVAPVYTHGEGGKDVIRAQTDEEGVWTDVVDLQGVWILFCPEDTLAYVKQDQSVMSRVARIVDEATWDGAEDKAQLLQASPASGAPAHVSARPPVPEDIAKLVEEALAIVGANVEVGAGVVHVSGAGSEGPIMPAVERLRTAHKRHPDLPVVHFAYCSALKIAMQNAEARSELEALAAEHPDFALARWTLADGGRWTSGYFALPEWGPATGSLPAMIGQQVIGCVLLAVRDGIEPRATLFFRDRGGHFANPVALRSARVEVAMVVDKLSGAPVVGIYARVWDNPNSPMTMESHGLPLAARGSAMRRAYEHLCGQLDLDFVVIANDDRVLMNRRLDMSAGMVARLVDLGTLLDHEEEHEYEPARLRAAINSHQERYSAANVFHD